MCFKTFAEKEEREKSEHYNTATCSTLFRECEYVGTNVAIG